MMVHHDNHHRPFTSPSYVGDGDVVPTGFSTTVAASGGLVEAAGGLVGDKRRPLPLLQQTHHHQPFQSSTPSSNPASSTSGMGYPFTQAQWRELERQAMIYKYMVASVPVPPHLLFSVSSIPGASQYSLAGGGYALRFGNGDPEPGRCRRTDGKKWRCSRDAAPDQKYCERHLNRGRPRSRKPVEVSASVSPSKKTRNYHSNNAPLPSSAAASATAGGFNTTTSHRNNQAPVFLQRNGGLDAISDAPNKEPRGLDWLMIGEPHICDETLSLNSNYNTDRASQFTESLFPLENSGIISLAETHSIAPRGFIDAWSDHNSKHNSSISTHDDKLSISEEMDHIQMGLGVTHWTRTGDTRSSSWISSAPGGPLAEVFRPASNVSCPSSPNSGSPLISSPSGVLQRKMASVSDSSGGSSPTLGNSMGRSEITVQWFNPN